MEYDSFWGLMNDVAAIGTFICAVPSEGGGSANLLGEFEIAYDGRENVFQVKGNSDHVHLNPAVFVKLSFSYFDVGYGGEPLITLIGASGKPMMKLYYTGHLPQQQYVKFAAKHPLHVEGKW